jgi:hypothetical protein
MRCFVGAARLVWQHIRVPPNLLTSQFIQDSFQLVRTTYGIPLDRHGNSASLHPAILWWLNKRFLSQRDLPNVDASQSGRHHI